MSFQSLPIHLEMLGTTHVAVGFNDLGILLTCDLREAPHEQPFPKALRFVGLDGSAFSVAKSLVVAEMLQMPGCQVVAKMSVIGIIEYLYTETSKNTGSIVLFAVVRAHKQFVNLVSCTDVLTWCST